MSEHLDKPASGRVHDARLSLLTDIEGAEKAFLAGRRNREADLESAVRFFLEFLRGFESFDFRGPCVTVFGSARFGEDHPSYQLARDLGRALATAGFAVMTGGGPGIMEAANRGAFEVGHVCDPRIAGSCTSGSVFALPVSASGVFHFGNLPRNAIIGPKFFNTDLSLVKKTRVGGATVEFRAEAFNVFNHPNFGQPGRIATVGSTSFGLITATRFPTGDSGVARQIQFAMKVLF